MPKIPIAKQDSASGPMTSASHPNVLRRNQACHQCRRRKLKCDAQKPCSTCVRSHAHALSHAPAGVIIPERPECTFDDVPSTAGAQEVPKNRYEKLETRINELEAMLKDQTSPAPNKSSPSSLSPALAQSPPSSLSNYTGLTNATISTPPSILHTPDFGLQQDYQPSPLTFTGVTPPLKSFISPVDTYPEEMKVPTAAVISEIQGDTTSFLPQGFGYDVIWPGWPRDLPSPSIVRHLVESFFAFHPHASRLFHVSTFVTSLNLPPNHPKFPSPCILHAICAVGSLYTMAIPPTPLPDKNMAAYEIFGGRYRPKDYVESFAEQQVKLARQTSEEQFWAGKKLLEGVQALLIITWWYWCHARWVEAFMTIAQAIRASIPLGLNVESPESPFSPLSDCIRKPSLIPPPENAVEEEVRRNTFWLLYAMERMGGCSNGWALSLDDLDVSQLLPMSGFNFELGGSWSGSERQHALGKNILLFHPEDQVDSFNLYIKGTILLSRVKTFNLRFRVKHFMGDPAYIYSPTYAEVWEKTGDEARDVTADPRRTPGFIEIDHIVSMFKQSFPLHLRNPIHDGCVDSHLYSASLIPHLAIILLHDPYAHIHSPGCVSAFKILEASRNILELIYAVYSTSFDVTLLDFFCSFAWFMAGRVLRRFWQAALDANSAEQVLTLRAEVEYIVAALAKLAERVPLADRYNMMLQEVPAKANGPDSICD